jgi:hypothetical protein
MSYQPAPSIDQLRQQAENSYAAQALRQRLEQGDEPPTAEDYAIKVWAFGDDLAMVFLSHEVVVDYALRLKQELDGPRLWITAYADEVSRYIVSKRLIAEGGYEVNNSLSFVLTYGRPEQVTPATEDQIVETVARLVPESSRKP